MAVGPSQSVHLSEYITTHWQRPTSSGCRIYDVWMTYAYPVQFVSRRRPELSVTGCMGAVVGDKTI